MKLTNDEVLQYLKNATLDDFSVSSSEISSKDGWIFYYYNDCGEIDYIEWIVAPDGRELDYKDISDGLQATFYNMFENC